MADKTEKMVRAKTRLLEKFKAALPRPPAGRRRLPPGQHLNPGFPVLDLGFHPAFDAATWRFAVEGEVENPLELTWQGLLELPKAEQVSDFHCVTTWSTYDLRWGGVKFSTLTEVVRPKGGATHLIQASPDGYTTNLPLSELRAPNIMLAYELNGQPLPLEHGGPLRLVVPHLYGWKSAKFLNRLIFQDHDTPGFWELRGYHNVGRPWKEERFG